MFGLVRLPNACTSLDDVWVNSTVKPRQVKEALHFQMTPSEECFNWDGGLEVPGCWTTVMRRLEGRSNHHQPLTSNNMYLNGAWL